MYVVHTDDEIRAALEQLPASASAAVAELRVALEVSPWTVAPSINPANENAAVRCFLLETSEGEGLVWYQPYLVAGVARGGAVRAGHGRHLALVGYARWLGRAARATGLHLELLPPTPAVPPPSAEPAQ